MFLLICVDAYVALLVYLLFLENFLCGVGPAYTNKNGLDLFYNDVVGRHGWGFVE